MLNTAQRLFDLLDPFVEGCCPFLFALANIEQGVEAGEPHAAHPFTQRSMSLLAGVAMPARKDMLRFLYFS